MMRNACGSNDHPDPLLFTQVFRLLCCYSLVKPPKGGNVNGSDLLKVLMEKTVLTTDKPSKDQWLQKLDQMLEGRLDLTDSNNNNDDVDKVTPNSSVSPAIDHNYNNVSTSDEVQAYIAGYIVQKICRSSKCLPCSNSLRSSVSKQRDKVVYLMSHGSLCYASDNLFNLTKLLEKTVLDVVQSCGIKLDIFYTILDKFEEIGNVPSVGCQEHRKDLTMKVVHLYLVMRGHFLTKSFNTIHNEKIVRTKMLRKNCKL
ncbi:uncharacterized protein [Prorops nasuta]|uniref:uncharacterized protein n=1 Tax=Prorops nasuta TaxID=863751 RepID=UPI0034CFEADD